MKRHKFVQRREAQGFTQESLAEQLDVDRTTIARWETGRSRPQPWMRRRLAAALNVTIVELDDLLRCSDLDTAERPQETAPDSRDRLTAGADLRVDFCEVAERYDTTPSTALLADAGRILTRVALAADDASVGRTARELRLLQAEAATFMGQLVWDASQRTDHATARGFYRQGVELARRLHDRALEGRALLRTGYVALYGERDPRAGLHLAREAADTAAAISPALVGTALLHVSEAHAMLGEADDCERTLAHAEEELSRADATDVAADLASPTQFDRLAGSCYLSLGRHRRAQRHLEATARQLRVRKKSRAIVLGNLALAHIRQDAPEAAVAVLDEAVTELEQTRGGGGMNVVFAAARELRPWRQRTEVLDMQDRLFGLVASR